MDREKVLRLGPSVLGSFILFGVAVELLLGWMSISGQVVFNPRISALKYLSILLPVAAGVYVFPDTRRFLESKLGMSSNPMITFMAFLLGLSGILIAFAGVVEAGQLTLAHPFKT